MPRRTVAVHLPLSPTTEFIGHSHTWLGTSHRNEVVPIVLSQLKKQLHSGPYQVCGSRRIKSTSSTEKVQQVEAPVNVSMEACIKVNAGCQLMWKTVYIAKTRKTPSYDEASHITSKEGATFVPSQTK